MRSLVLVNCSKTKSLNPLELPEIAGGRIKAPGDDLENEDGYRAALGFYLTKAADLYVGPEFKAYKELAASRGASLLIMSARYGVIGGDREVIPYDSTLSNKGLKYIEEMVDKWFKYGNYDVDRLTVNWDCAVIRLSGNYLRALILIGRRLGIDPCKLGRKTLVVGGSLMDELRGDCVKIRVKGNGDARSHAVLSKVASCLG